MRARGPTFPNATDRHVEGGGTLGVSHGAALYVGSLVGPGVLLVPALALQVAGPASLIAWAALLVLSAPLATTFAALGVRLPVAGGVAAYVRMGFGNAAGAITGGWFLTAVLLGAPTVSIIGGYYVADLTGSDRGVAAAVALAMFATVLLANAFGLRLSSRFQLVLAAALAIVIATAVAVALPVQDGGNWTPFAPHGWWAVGTAANVLVWQFVGWEAGAQLAGEFRDPAAQLPRAVAVAFGAVTILFAGLAVATVGVSSSDSRVPLADLIAVGFGAVGRDATALLAVALTMGAMNVYVAGTARLAAAQALDGALPGWLGGDAHRSIPRRPLAVIALIGTLLLVALIAGVGNATEFVRATAACFIAVYVAATASAVRILTGLGRAAAVAAFVLTTVLAAFSGWFVLAPIIAAVVSLAVRALSPAPLVDAPADERPA
jgi:amino acid efflux transporter